MLKESEKGLRDIQGILRGFKWFLQGGSRLLTMCGSKKPETSEEELLLLCFCEA